jgi:hypothetical protein
MQAGAVLVVLLVGQQRVLAALAEVGQAEEIMLTVLQGQLILVVAADHRVQVPALH